MNISQKCQYALRSVFELARRRQGGPVTVAEIAAAQAIPPRFLEVILVELRKAGFVKSRRGVHGGYQLAVLPQSLTVGTVIEFVDGPVAPVKCVADPSDVDCALYGNCAFMPLWEQARDALATVYNGTTFQDLIEQEHVAASKHVGRNI